MSLRCDMRRECEQPVTHIDDKGYVYCAGHGLSRRAAGHRCRKLRAAELRRLHSGQPIAHY